MSVFAALDVSQELTAVCVVNHYPSIIAEAKCATRPDPIKSPPDPKKGKAKPIIAKDRYE